MDVIVTSDNAQLLDVWRQHLGAGLPVELWKAEPRDVPADAVMVSGMFAHGRYGGRPTPGRAQILRNGRGDGYPGLVVVPATRPAMLDAEGQPVVRPEYADISPAYFGVSRALDALREWNASGQEPRVEVLLFPLGLLGMESPADTATPESVGRAVREWVNQA
ncbi:hypothetical protein SAMN05216251_10581 [Actinacidiphila alni]|uniref:Appr-1-p processing protein n=1 Tax=Actinacidiphila alni TaxID=380248 RepID=A0A1I2D4X9_9ACTN|nr:hypothetical protein [Actinacidiphila alni]SFE75561.1 hypothetical protein SAMN05216251_10581 [Actinacidiphila alni]